MDPENEDSIKNKTYFKVDELVEARWRNGDSWIRGQIVKQRGNETYDIFYDFGKNMTGVQSWHAPDVGHMTLDFVNKERFTCASRRPGSRPRSRPSSRRQTVADTLVRKRTASSTIQYRLNLSREDDRIMLAQILRAARLQPGENIVNERYEGKAFDFDEETSGQHWIEKKTDGVFECEFKTTQLTLENHFEFDLSLESDTIIAIKILERVFMSKYNENTTDEEWMNARLNVRDFLKINSRHSYYYGYV